MKCYNLTIEIGSKDAKLASAQPGNLSEMKIFRLYLRPGKSEISGVGPRNLGFHKLPRGF